MPIVGDPLVSGVERFYLVDTAGAVHSTNPEDDVFIEWGPTGLLMPPVRVVDRELPLLEGSQLQGVRVPTREWDLPIFVKATTPAALVNRHEQLLTWIDPSRGTIILRIQRADDTWRELVAIYAGGLEGDESLRNGVLTWWRGAATFRAQSPYWRDVEDTVLTYALAGVSGTWFPLVFPIFLAGSQVFVQTNILNDGTALTWPRFTVTGPGTDLVLRNLTTGQYLGVTHTLGAGEQLTVDMAPLVEAPIVDSGGNNRFRNRTAGSERWPLVVGNNVVQIEMPGATSTSGVALAYRRQWLRR